MNFPFPSRLLTFGTCLCSWWVLPAHRSKLELLHAAQQSILHTAVFPASAKEQRHCQGRRHSAQSMFISCDTEHSICKELRKKTAAAATLITFPQTSTVIYNLDDVAGTKYDLDPHASSPPHFYRPCVIRELQLFKLFLWVRLSPVRFFIAHSPFATGKYRIWCRQ